ncbi:hypothetical protein LJR225_004672 [Phenylobacterium sp. LjRoot225]
MRRLDVTLDDTFLLPEGRVFITGVQARIHVLLDPHRLEPPGSRLRMPLADEDVETAAIAPVHAARIVGIHLQQQPPAPRGGDDRVGDLICPDRLRQRLRL